MPTSSEKLLGKMEKSHQDLMERIDKLDGQITEILKNWNDLDSIDPIFPKTGESDRLTTVVKQDNCPN